jgi:hypothetical protein
MALVQWNPSTQISRGNVAVGVAPVVADINDPLLVELNTGTGLNCSIQTQNGTSSTDSESIDWLCDPSSEQLPGSTTHEMDDLVIKGTGQADADLIESLNVGDTVYVWRRDGISQDTALAAGQFVWVWKVIITSIDPLEANNTFIGVTAHITVQARSRVAVPIAA